MLALRAHLDAAQLFDTKIVVYDNWVYADPLPAGAAAAGIHYPGIGTGRPELGFPMWSSEESSTYNNDVGAGCWARCVRGRGGGGGGGWSGGSWSSGGWSGGAWVGGRGVSR